MGIGAEIIAEAGRRLGGTASPTVNKVIERSLAGEDIEGDDVAQDALAWLQGQPLIKHEENVAYPKEAFAYTPEEDPATWSLRLWESDMPTKRQLDRVSASLSPGGFNGERHQIPAPDLPLVKYRIREAYRRLGTDEGNISRWATDAGQRELISEYIPLTEAKVDSKGKAVITVIKAGFNSSKEHYYPKETLARDYKIFEGLKMYADHPTETEERERPERSVRDWVGTLSNVRLDEQGDVIGDATIVKPWLQETLATLRDNGLLNQMGASINAIGKAINTKVEGVETALVDKFIRARSVDFVTEAGAGGGVLLYEAGGVIDIDLIGLEALQERRPDLVEQIETEVRNQFKKEVKMTEDKDAQIATLEKAVETVTAERDELLTKAQEAEKEREKAEAKAVIDTAIAEADLPAPAKKRLSKQFEGATSDEGLTEAIAQEKEYIAEVTEGSGVKGMGPTTPDSEADKKALRETWANTHPEWNEKQVDIAVRGR